MKLSRLTLLLILLAGAALRVAGANHPLWLDEIWSCDIASKLSSPFGVLTEPAALIDNNHPLNTFWLALLGNRQPYWMYHVPALVAGIVTIVLVGVAAQRRSTASALWATALAAASLPLIQFSDEARGYSLAAMWAAGMLIAFERFMARPRWWDAVLFLICCVGGGLSHLMILHVYVGLAAVSVWSFWQRRKINSPVRTFAMLHAGPLLFWLAYYALFVGRLKFGGGAPRWYLFDSVCGALASLIGWTGPASWLPALMLVVALVTLAVSLARRSDPMWLFIVVGCFLSPILLVAPQWILSASPVPMAARYFLPLVPIVIVLIGEAIARFRWLGGVAAVLIVLNVINSVRMIVIGPGDGAAVITAIAADDAQPHILADHPLRTKMVLDFYARRLFPDRSITVTELTDRTSAEAADAKWFVVHARGTAAPAVIDLGVGKPFRLLRTIPAFGLSGYDFEIYRRSD